MTCYWYDVTRGGLTQDFIADESDYPTCGLSVKDDGTIRLRAVGSHGLGSL